MMYDEASKMIASIDVAYVASLCIAGHFHSVPIVFSAAPNGTEIGTTACTYLNTSLHQSQVVTSPGFVMVEHARTSMNVISFGTDGKFLSYRAHRRSEAYPQCRHRTAADDDVARCTKPIKGVMPQSNWRKWCTSARLIRWNTGRGSVIRPCGRAQCGTCGW